MYITKIVGGGLYSNYVHLSTILSIGALLNRVLFTTPPLPSYMLIDSFNMKYALVKTVPCILKMSTFQEL